MTSVSLAKIDLVDLVALDFFVGAIGVVSVGVVSVAAVVSNAVVIIAAVVRLIRDGTDWSSLGPNQLFFMGSVKQVNDAIFYIF